MRNKIKIFYNLYLTEYQIVLDHNNVYKNNQFHIKVIEYSPKFFSLLNSKNFELRIRDYNILYS